ncbi:gamma-glutamylcyclotransferase [Horticoccus luteus]|uniref:Gamma-glutamylcyclotransferase family protein n=1 Tax=Horticoccus luteus TaxID=2862869 RepID=A0A8F9XHZ5_9BACT|nr:gamma-glutamylcyclotransferase family protein [Horticoccus luteus]QYM79885.1 gamma-glutamylcyclotransferase [Horticoccus luteus]
MLLFVYGTLKRGGANHGLLAQQRFIGEARTVRGFTLFALDGYPGLIAAPHAAGVTGEVWDVNAPQSLVLDEFEGVAEGLYARELIALAPPFESASVETYYYLRNVEGRRPLGDTWRG